MKPKKRVYCVACHRHKMLFGSEKEANDFIRWNSKSMKKKPTRAYWCSACCGWHITSSHGDPYDNTSEIDSRIAAYKADKKNYYKMSGQTKRSMTNLTSQKLSYEQRELVRIMQEQSVVNSERRMIENKKRELFQLQEKYSKNLEMRKVLMFKINDPDEQCEKTRGRIEALKNLEAHISNIKRSIESKQL